MYPEYSASSTFFKNPIMTFACASARPAAGHGIGSPFDVRGYNNQTGKVADQVHGKFCNHVECRKGPSDRRRSRVVNGTGLVSLARTSISSVEQYSCDIPSTY